MDKKKRFLYLLMTLVMLFTTIFGNAGIVLGDDTGTSLAEWSVTKDTAPATADDGSLTLTATAGTDTAAVLSVSGATYTGFSSSALACNGWTTGGYWLMTVDSTGYDSLAFSAQMRATGTGPANFALQYRTTADGEWKYVDGGTIAITTAKKLQNWFSADSVALPTEACNCATLQLRIVMTDDASVNGGTVAEGGVCNLNSVKIAAGTASAETAAPAATETTTETPAATETATATPAAAETVTTVTGTYVETLTAGTQVVVYYPASQLALSDTVSGKKLAGVSAAVDGTTLTATDALVLNVVDEGSSQYSFTTTDGKYLTSGSTGNSLTLADAASDYSLWTLETADGGVYIKNVNAAYNGNAQYMEYYNGFTMYGMNSSKASIYTMQFYQVEQIVTTEAPTETEAATATPEAAATPTPEATETAAPEATETAAPAVDTVTGTYVETPVANSQVVVYYPASQLVLTGTASGSKLAGASATVDGTTLTAAKADALVLNVVDEGDNQYSFTTTDGKYLTSGSTGNSLTLADAASDYSLWTLETADGGVYIKNVNAAYSGNAQYVEYYKGFTMYGMNSSKASIYTMQFYQVGEAPDYTVDTSAVFDVAQWGGGGPYDETANASMINGDLTTIGDQLDESAVYTVRANGADGAKPYTTGTSGTTGVVSYYMGATGIGAGDGDYAQFAFSSAGYGAMQMSFRLRASNSGAGSFTLQYSTDGGATFTDFTTGTYSYSYTQYGSDGSQTPVSKDGEITDGVAKTSLNPGGYVSFTFDVPSGADNAELLLIRLVPGTDKANGKEGTPDKGGTLRIDTVSVTGSPIVSDKVCGYVSAEPTEGEVAAGEELTLTTKTADAQIYYTINDGAETLYDAATKPVLTADVLPAVVTVYAKKDGISNSIKTQYSYTQAQVAAVKATPNGGAVTAGTRVNVTCATENAKILYSTDEGATWQDYSASAKITVNSFPMTVQIKATKDGYLDSAVTTLSFTERENENYNIYFGQMHSHTNYSDGAGSCEDAYQHASEVDNLDFLAVTDHSNSFDNASSASLADGSVSEEWTEGQALADEYTTSDFVCLFGFEMTWSNGLGHINTFNTAGFQSRTQSEYSTYSTALQNYYATLKTDTGSISQFNHPGTTFGDFSDFAYYDADIDALITMIEVGNGEGTIGSSGYFPSYEYYTRALDKGWHVAPTNNQDNHKGLWGDANTARTVILADSLTRENIYDAVRNYRTYATEDNDLSIYYTLDDYIMGTILEQDAVGDTVTLKAEISDPTDEEIGKVEVIVNGGLSVASQTVTDSEETVTFEVPSTYSYYYLKITEADGDIAVTAPVWVGDVEAVGITDFSTDAALPVQDQALDLTLDLYNNEDADLELTSIEFTIDDEVIHTVDLTEAGLTKAGSMDTASYTFSYTYDKVGQTNIYATVKGTLNGVEKSYTEVLQLTFVPPEMVTKVVVDGTHYNDYVTGYYGANMSNFTTIAAEQQIEVSIETEKITAETLADCQLLVISAPAKKSGTANAGAYVSSTFDDEFIQLVSDYVKSGGSVVVCGLADYQDSRSDTTLQSSTQINKLLEGIGATLRINDDEVYDPDNNGGQAYRLYPTNFNTDSKWLSGVVTGEDGQTYSQYSGCSVDMTNATANDTVKEAEWLVKGFDTTYSVDSDKDGVGNNGESDGTYNLVCSKGDVTFLAVQETVYGGNIFVGGGVFLSDFEVEAELDNIWDLPYANRTIAENILSDVKVELPLSTIAEMRQGEMGDVFRIQGYVTAGTDNEDTKFFDAIYVQDETGGTTVFPFSEEGVAIGTKIEITGYVDAYQGDKEIQVMSYEILDDDPVVYEPKKVTNKEAMDYDTNGGQLLAVEGRVTDVTLNDDGTVSEFTVEDEAGDTAKVFIDGYILSGTTGENTLASFVTKGNVVSAAGILYMHPEGDSDESVAVLRVRDCDEVTLVSGAYYYGDVNLDGSVNADDAVLILKHVVKLETLGDGDDADTAALKTELADPSHDGAISALDALNVLRVTVQLDEKEVYTGTLAAPVVPEASAETVTPAA